MDDAPSQEKSSGVKLNFAIPDQLPFKLPEKLVEDDHDLIMALGRQALKERRAARDLADRKKVRNLPLQKMRWGKWD